MRRLALAAIVVLSIGCNGLSLKRADGAPMREAFKSVLRLHAPSDPAAKYLATHGIESSWTFSPDEAITKLQSETTAEGQVVLAEMCDLSGRESEVWSRSKSVERYLDAAYHASLALGMPAESLDAKRRADAVKIYNHAVARFLRRSGGRKLRPDDKWEEGLAKAGLKVRVRRDGAVWTPEPFDEFQFADDYMAIGVPSHKTDGIGVPLFAVKERGWRDPERASAPERFFPPLKVYAATALLRFGPEEGNVRPVAMLELHDPLRYDAVTFAGKNEKLAADPTTPLVYQVTQSDFDKNTYLGFLDPQATQHKTGLFLEHPYERGKIPVILIHGLWSSPKTWTRAINDLRADPTIRDRYQFWTFQYPTGNPFIHSASILRQQIAEVRAAFDPDHSDPAFDQAVVVGHSMGGLVAKTLIASSGDNVWKLISSRPFADLKATTDEKGAFAQVFFFEPVPEVKRVVYISVPHRGSALSNNWLGQLGDWAIRRPNVLVDAQKALLRENDGNFFTDMFQKGVPSSVGLLQVHSPLLQTVDQLPIRPGVVRHSIISQLVPTPNALSTDGIVPYDSSHIDGVASEKVVTGPHACLDEPDVIDELRRILLLHIGAEASR
ncbi:MAG: esterase/lipase family protein [Gemmataceae bacterium]